MNKPEAPPVTADGVLYSSFPVPIGSAQPTRLLSASETDPRQLLAEHVDTAYYRACYPDIDLPDIDPLAHFADHGWREGRNPNAWFDTVFYLERYPDIRDADLNPLLHYLTAGAAEGRQPRPPGGAARQIAARAIPPAQRQTGYDAPQDAPRLYLQDLVERLALLCVDASGLVLSVSHDRSIDVIGGVQIFIADEEALFQAQGVAYLHISPAIARLTLDSTTDSDAMLQVVIGGAFQGLASPADLVAALRAATPALEKLPRRLLIIHSLFGHRIEELLPVAQALAPTRSHFWLHDYATICEGFNLLRNDWNFCGAPAQGSTACRICVYGPTRGAYRGAIRRLFDAIAFDVLAPSVFALALWLARADLPYRSARVHENCTLLMEDDATTTAAPEGPIRVAFVGYPLPHKGWHLFLELLRVTHGMARYKFYHFAIEGAQLPHDGLMFVPTQVDRDNRMAMVDALAAHSIDLVAVLSPWPETFSYVTHEAMAAGADVVALADSGNVADAIRLHQRGVVLTDAVGLERFFAGDGAQAYVAAQRATGRRRGHLRLSGTTATLPAEA